jgi:hypothetical protein
MVRLNDTVQATSPSRQQDTHETLFEEALRNAYRLQPILGLWLRKLLAQGDSSILWIGGHPAYARSLRCPSCKDNGQNRHM